MLPAVAVIVCVNLHLQLHGRRTHFYSQKLCRLCARHQDAKGSHHPRGCTNATGTDRLKLVVIHTAAKPRDFGNLWKPSDHVDYFNNKKAWMTRAVFESWIKSVNSRMASHSKSVVILMDNASSHAIPTVATTEQCGLHTIKLSNVLVVFLPASTTCRESDKPSCGALLLSASYQIRPSVTVGAKLTFCLQSGMLSWSTPMSVRRVEWQRQMLSCLH